MTNTPPNTVIEPFCFDKAAKQQVSEALSAYVGQAKHAGIKLSFKFETEPQKQVPKTGNTTFPPTLRKAFLFKSTHCSVPVKSWHSFSLLADMNSFL